MIQNKKSLFLFMKEILQVNSKPKHSRSIFSIHEGKIEKDFKIYIILHCFNVFSDCHKSSEMRSHFSFKVSELYLLENIQITVHPKRFFYPNR